MTDFRHTPFRGELEVVSTLRDGVIAASITEMRRQDELTRALFDCLRAGVGIDELSAASGLTPAEIRRRTSDLEIAEIV